MTIQCPKCKAENPDTASFCADCGTKITSPKDIGVTKTIIASTTGLQKGSTIAGKYRILEELGRGGMGVVYKAEDTKLKRTVALKFLPPELTHIPDVKDRFMREAQAAAALDHPNICTVYEFDEAEEKTFISMAYVEGQSLRKKLESGPLELDEALRIALQVAEGLQIAHKKGVVHRDIKSANIMVTEDNQAKIMDFGLARMTGGTLITQEGMTMGTIAYMSPEQAQGEDVDHRTDIWSFGVVLYEMFGGQLPFMGEQDQAVVYSILNKKPKPITELRSEIPVSIGQVVDKALEKDADKRYQQVEELLDDLKSISVGIVPEEIKVRLRKAKLLKRKRSILYAGAVGLVIVIAVLALTLFTGRAEAIDSIAVLPLENLTGDAEQEYFVDGVTDELIGQLGEISGLQRVISRTSVMRYKNTDKSLPEIARELNVDALVEGTVYQVGENVSVKLQLFDALPEERSLWTQRYDRPITDVLAMYGEMAGAIAENIKVKLTAQEETRFADVREVDPEAYQNYLLGLYHWNNLSLQKSIEYFQKTIDKEPSFAPAYVGLSNCYWASHQFMNWPAPEAWSKAKEAALKALEIDDKSAEAHAQLGLILVMYDWDWEGAEKEFKRAMELNKNIPLVYIWYSALMSYAGWHEEAISTIKKAEKLDPLSLVYMINVEIRYYNAGLYDQAIAQCHKILDMNPNYVPVYQYLSQNYSAKGMLDEAVLNSEKFVGFFGGMINDGLPQVGYMYGRAGRETEAREILQRLETESKQMYIPPFYFAWVHIGLGEKEEAFEWLEKACQEHDPRLLWYLRDPMLKSLGSDPRHADLVRRVGFPDVR